mmetsp:Transcript_140095/g.355235  ORF Transcript_140095/g.355235 Transcript_140095/m.355235 type:complete len:228 (-) Transcript_140095:87-770(-)
MSRSRPSSLAAMLTCARLTEAPSRQLRSGALMMRRKDLKRPLSSASLPSSISTPPPARADGRIRASLSSLTCASAIPSCASASRRTRRRCRRWRRVCRATPRKERMSAKQNEAYRLWCRTFGSLSERSRSPCAVKPRPMLLRPFLKARADQRTYPQATTRSAVPCLTSPPVRLQVAARAQTAHPSACEGWVHKVLDTLRLGPPRVLGLMPAMLALKFTTCLQGSWEI